MSLRLTAPDRRRAQYSANPAKIATRLTLEIRADRISKVLLGGDLYRANGFHRPACGLLRSVTYTLTTAMFHPVLLQCHVGGTAFLVRLFSMYLGFLKLPMLPHESS